MTTISANEAKSQLPLLLDRVAQGEEILITRNGKPVALLTVPLLNTRSVQKTVAEMLAYRDKQKRTTGDVTLKDLINEGRS